jgi:hypothetical protein
MKQKPKLADCAFIAFCLLAAVLSAAIMGYSIGKHQYTTASLAAAQCICCHLLAFAAKI